MRQQRWRAVNDRDIIVRVGLGMETDIVGTLLAGSLVSQVGEDKVGGDMAPSLGLEVQHQVVFHMFIAHSGTCRPLSSSRFSLSSACSSRIAKKSHVFG